ncbi:MAG TPA: 2-oxo-4-hydroxy-4-carboxy-5-ureidoimidazoline decarboxylase [Streptosporangiaceae bacterium]|jgi:2-oxo-4-hydroxy-4-carboxy-5-ureidoimidazoline decarboxylase
MTRPAAVPTALAAFNAAPRQDAERDLMRCCASGVFAAAVCADRPFSRTEELNAAVDAAFSRLDWPDIEEALAAHPRIGEPGRSDWSRAEQAGAAGVEPAVAQALADGNRAYEQRFGQVFLICATGLSATQILASLQARLTHDPAAERCTVREELRKITQLRIAKLLVA